MVFYGWSPEHSVSAKGTRGPGDLPILTMTHFSTLSSKTFFISLASTNFVARTLWREQLPKECVRYLQLTKGMEFNFSHH